MMYIEADFKVTRRQTLHALRNEAGDLKFTAQHLSAVLSKCWELGETRVLISSPRDGGYTMEVDIVERRPLDESEG